MSRHKRLFLFAAYDPDGIIDDALIHYIAALSRHGDVILCMDNKFDKRQIKKLRMHPLSVFITRHKEYDFGSYKRAFQYARDKQILDNYDFVYLVNDSVFGPMFNIRQTLKNMETANTDAVGMVVAKHKTHSYMESWFIRLNKKIFLSQWFDEFLSSVKREEYKFTITIKYEHGLTNLIQNHGCNWAGLYTYRGRKTYNQPKKLFLDGCPFVKKASFTRHNGAIGNQIKYILQHADPLATQSTMRTCKRIYGEQYMKRLLTYNPFKIMWRKITYAISKLKSIKI